MKVAGYLIVAFLWFFLVPLLVFACDPLGCLLIGKDQDMLAIVSVSSVNGRVARVTADHYYDQSQLKPKSPFLIDFVNGTPGTPLTPEVGDHYFASLACDGLRCEPKWGVWEVDNADFRTAKLLDIRGGDDAAIQWFMNGKGSDFYSSEDRTYARTKNGNVEIYPNNTILQSGIQERKGMGKKLVGLVVLLTILTFGRAYFRKRKSIGFNR